NRRSRRGGGNERRRRDEACGQIVWRSRAEKAGWEAERPWRRRGRRDVASRFRRRIRRQSWGSNHSRRLGARGPDGASGCETAKRRRCLPGGPDVATPTEERLRLTPTHAVRVWDASADRLWTDAGESATPSFTPARPG